MFNIQDINSYINYLTGEKDFIVARPIKKFPLSQKVRLSQVKRKRLKVYVDRTQNQIFFHEFCHFIESEESDIFLPDFGLYLNPESRLRETKVRCIQNILAPVIGKFSGKSLMRRVKIEGSFYFSSYEDFFNIIKIISPSDLESWDEAHSLAMCESSKFRNFDFIVEKIKKNIKICKLSKNENTYI
ncbi:MAG TPA: hypothetical protein PLP33_27180 [Leptospiraceae bacterium]|nr:hypothetical protein [Leptospiraceae bacterium]